MPGQRHSPLRLRRVNHLAHFLKILLPEHLHRPYHQLKNALILTRTVTVSLLRNGLWSHLSHDLMQNRKQVIAKFRDRQTDRGEVECCSLTMAGRALFEERIHGHRACPCGTDYCSVVLVACMSWWAVFPDIIHRHGWWFFRFERPVNRKGNFMTIHTFRILWYQFDTQVIKPQSKKTVHSSWHITINSQLVFWAQPITVNS